MRESALVEVTAARERGTTATKSERRRKGDMIMAPLIKQGCPGVPWRFYSILRMSKLLYTY